jgi:hypothetical protein
MTIKEIFHLNDFLNKIKLDNSENDFIIFHEEEKTIPEKMKDEKFSVSEWNQEYELIYSAYILDK